MICSKCGFNDAATASKPWNSGMTLYVTPDGKDFGVLNDNADTVTIPPSKNFPQGVVLTAKTVYEKQQATKLTPTPATVVSTTKTVPAPPTVN